MGGLKCNNSNNVQLKVTRFIHSKNNIMEAKRKRDQNDNIILRLFGLEEPTREERNIIVYQTSY